jgi:hypothetical protein
MPQKNTDGVLVVKERPNLVMLLLEHRRALEKTSRGAGMVASYEVAKAFALSAGLCAGRCSEIKTLHELHIAKADFLRR